MKLENAQTENSAAGGLSDLTDVLDASAKNAHIMRVMSSSEDMTWATPQEWFDKGPEDRMKELDALRKLAEAADLNIDWIGAGPTRHGDLISTSGKPLFIDSVYLDCDEQDVDGDDYFVCSAGSDKYGRFIAAASPRTVIRLLDDLKAAEHQRDELIAQKFSEEPLRRQIAELRELGRFREKHFLTGSPEVYDDPSAAFHKFACEMHDALKVGGGETAHNSNSPTQNVG